jgi:hypothetical protein
LKGGLLRRLVPELLAAAFFLGLAVVATRPLAAHLETHVVGAGDPIVDLWTIDWLTEHFFQSGQIFQGNIFHPAPHAVLYSDLSLGAVVLLLPFRHLLADPVPLYNVAVLLTLAFAGWSFHALVHALTANRWAACWRACWPRSGPIQISHRPHINLLVIGWLALFLLGLHLVIRGTPGLGRGAGGPLLLPVGPVQRLLRRVGARPRPGLRRLPLAGAARPADALRAGRRGPPGRASSRCRTCAPIWRCARRRDCGGPSGCRCRCRSSPSGT